MPDIPKHRKIQRTRREWVIGHEDHPTDAKNFRYGLLSIYQQMEELGVDLTYDDAFHVRSGEGGEVILFIDIEEQI